MSTTTLPPNAIPFDTAKKWVDNWKASDHRLVNQQGQDIINFFVPKIDLSEVLNEKGTNAVRTYLGIDETGEFHLLIAAVDSDDNVLVDPKLGQYVYDFTRPCPPTCSKNDPFK
jgi:hypothetical protein